MNRTIRVILALTLLGMFWSALIGGTMLLLPPAKLAAQAPPSKTPIDPPTNTPTDPPTTPPTAEPTTEEPPTNTPTDPPTNTPTDPPTNTPTDPPTNTPTEGPTKEPKPKPPSKPDPNCQSLVEGDVLTSAGRHVTGATVSIEGSEFSRAMMTNDNGHYGFGGLCPGQVTLRAATAGGNVGPAVTVELDGKISLQVDLSLPSGGATAPTAGTIPTTQSTSQPTSQPGTTPEPSMPSTGYSGLFLAIGAVLGILLLLFAGARRAWGS
jgi:hypothetical protein